MKTKSSVGRIQYNFHILKRECDNKILYCKKNPVVIMNVQLLLVRYVFVCLNLIENISVPRRFKKYEKNLIIVNQPVLVRFEIFTAESMTFDVS